MTEGLEGNAVSGQKSTVQALPRLKHSFAEKALNGDGALEGRCWGLQ